MTSKIYIIRNDINDKVYIGKTTLPTIDARFKEHCKDAFRERNEKRPLYSAMRKYGIEHFTISLIEECQVKDDCEREIYWIQQYNSYKNGYNATFGGDGKHYLDYEKIASAIKENPDKSYQSLAKELGCSIDSVSLVAHQYGLDKIHDQLIYNKNTKNICQYDKDGNLINTFSSIRGEAVPWLFDNGYIKVINGGVSGHISEACKGKRKTAYGFIWKYA